MFSQSKADFQRVEKIAVNAEMPTISPDHNAAKVPTKDQQIKIDYKNQLRKVKAELVAVRRMNKENPTDARTALIADMLAIIAKLEKKLGI